LRSQKSRFQVPGVRCQESEGRSEDGEHLVSADGLLPLKRRRSSRIDDFRLTISDFINLQSTISNRQSRGRDLRYACLLATAYCRLPTAYCIQDSGFRKGKNRIQDSGFRIRDSGSFSFKFVTKLGDLRGELGLRIGADDSKTLRREFATIQPACSAGPAVLGPPFLMADGSSIDAGSCHAANNVTRIIMGRAVKNWGPVTGNRGSNRKSRIPNRKSDCLQSLAPC